VSYPNQFPPGPHSTPVPGYTPHPGGPQPQGQAGTWQQPQPGTWQQSQPGTWQQPPASGPIASPPPVPPVQPRRRRGALITAVVVILVLAIAGSTVLVLRNRGSDDARERGTWSQGWVDGFEEAWSLEAPANFRRQEMSMRTSGNRMVRIVSTSSTATVTVFDISKDSPKQLWEIQQQVTETVDRTLIWGNKIVVENTLIDITSHERSTAPWGTDSRVAVTSRGAISCVEATCRCWSSPSKMLWETDFATDSPMRVHSYAVVDEHVLAASSDYEYFVVDLNTGTTNPLKTNGQSIQRPLADGWLVHTSGKSYTDETIYLYEPDGTFSESFESHTDEPFSTYPWSPTPFTREQARLWFKDFDTSWAPSTYTLSEADRNCESITVNGNDIVLGEENSLFTANRNGKCTSTSALQAMYHSGEGQVQDFSRRDGDERSLVLVDMLTGRSSEPISLGTRDEFASYTALGDLLIIEFESGEFTAYRPTSS